jgi:hypothetical protein
MEPAWWEGLVKFLDRYWWLVLLILVLVLTAYFTHGFGLIK